ncbi:MAG: SPOR domain-containing protein [Prolixibacteraceae bacterium]|nr:SPOR domain-containing protein [Prolixibacteraceae bacterium]
MKRIILVAFSLALLTSGCKVFKSSKQSEAVAPQTETSTEAKVFSVPAPKTTVRENPVSDNMYATDKAVSMRSENFTMSSEDQAVYGNKSYFVIVGSFSSNENAGRFKQELVQKGFKPIVLHSETGYYRVCVDSFNDEAAARSRVQRIRVDYPKYADSWLLIKK